MASTITDAEVPPSLFPEIITQKAVRTPDGIWCYYCTDDWRNDTLSATPLQSITYLQAATAVDRLCHWLDQNLGPSKAFDAFAYYGPNDARYILLIIACQKARRQIVIPALVWLTSESFPAFLDEAGCSILLGGSASTLAASVAKLGTTSGKTLLELPPLEFWLAKEGTSTPYLSNLVWDEAKTNPVFVLHSSGTTGTPKKLVFTAELIGVANMSPELPSGSRDNSHLMLHQFVGKTFIWAAPTQWLGGIIGFLFLTLFYDVRAIWPPASEPQPIAGSAAARLAAKLFDVLGEDGFDGGAYLPATLKDLCRDERTLPLLLRHRSIIYGGAALDEWVGDLLCTKTNLVSLLGSTESNLLIYHKLEDRRDWQYFHFDSRMNARFEPLQGADDPSASPDKTAQGSTGAGEQLFELVVYRKPEHGRYQGALIAAPEQQCWRSNDLYARHPSKPNLYRYRGRADDLFKTRQHASMRAAEMESALGRHRAFANVMVGGEGKPTPYAILELVDAPLASRDIGKENTSGTNVEANIWEIVAEANERVAAEIKIPKKNIIIASRDKPLKRLGKGTLNRRAIIVDYREEIDNLYQDD